MHWVAVKPGQLPQKVWVPSALEAEKEVPVWSYMSIVGVA